MMLRLLALCGTLAVLCGFSSAEELRLSEHLTVFRHDDHNVVQGRDADGRTFQLLCDFRRDGRGIDLVPIYYVGKNELQYVADPIETYWKSHAEKGRFNELAGTSLIPIVGPENSQVVGVAEGDVLDPQRNNIHVIDTPGMTRGSVSYYVDLDGKRTVFCGNLIYGDGGLVNLYDLQDVMPVPKIGVYHGYMARGLQVIASLEKIKNLNPHRLIPARGPVIENPQESIDKLIERLRAVYENYLSTSALWWYFPDSMLPAARLFSGNPNLQPDAVRRMPQAKLHEKPPWLLEFATSRIIVSKNKAAFLIDSVGEATVKHLDKLIADGTISTVEGIYLTHYHWDHTGVVPVLAEKFRCPIYCDEKMGPVLEFRDNDHMPCRDSQSFKTQSFQTLNWQEFTLTSCFFPGQTLYHGALHVSREGERSVFFIGDSFTPDGIDDYCLWNRNFPGDDEGYLFCLEKLRKMNPRPLLVNQHVSPPFEFDDDRIDYMVGALKARRRILATLFPYASPEFGNGVGFGLDSRWARLEPYYVSLNSLKEEPPKLQLIVHNHADRPLTFFMEWKTENERRRRIPLPVVPPHRELTLSSLHLFSGELQVELGAVRPITAVVRCHEIPSLEMSVETMIGR